MEFGSYIKSAIVSISGLILFFLGTLLPLMEDLELIPLFTLFLLTVIVSFHNRTPIGAFFMDYSLQHHFL